jgi:hypothetical protein
MTAMFAVFGDILDPRSFGGVALLVGSSLTCAISALLLSAVIAVVLRLVAVNVFLADTLLAVPRDRNFHAGTSLPMIVCVRACCHSDMLPFPVWLNDAGCRRPA